VTSQRLGLVIIGADGKEVYGGPNRDARGVFEGAEIDATLGDSIWQATGHGPALVLAWSKLAWFRNHAPDRFSRARSAAGLADWLAYRLTGVLLMESALAVESGLAFVATGLPAAVLKDSLGLGGIDLPVSCEAGQIVGTLKSAPASELGLREGTPVVACGPDTQAGLAGLGVCEPGSAGVIAGWSAAVQLVTAQPVFDQTRSLWTGRHILHRRWVLEGNAGEMGGAYEWLAGLISGGRASSRTYGELDRLAAAVEPGARGVSAYLGPSFTSMSHIGLKTGALLFPAPLAFEPPDRGSLARAAIESFAFAIRYNLDRLRLVAGDWQDVAAGGGMVRSRTFREVTAATTGRPVAFGTAGDATLRGALSVTGAGTGDGLTMERALEGRRREVHVVEPSAADAARYEDLYLNWRARERRILEMEL
jgi:autoinducer 2 (AI-2) kinase